MYQRKGVQDSAAPTLLLLATLTVTATTLAMPYAMTVAVDTTIAAGNMCGLTRIALLYLALTGLYWVAIYWQGYLSMWVGQHVVHDLRRDLLAHVLRQSMAFHSRERVGEITSRLTNNVNAVMQMVSNSLLNRVSDLISLGGIIMASLNWRLMLVAIVSIPVVMISTNILGKEMRKAYRRVQSALAR